jgi:hypothetical protein
LPHLVAFDDVGGLHLIAALGCVLDLFSWLLTPKKVMEESAMAVAALKRIPLPELKTYHATMLVTRAEEWCVDAQSPEEARELLAAGLGHRCHLGERVQFEVESVAG